MTALERAPADMARQGAKIVDEVRVPEIDQFPLGRLHCSRFKYDIDAYLAQRQPEPPVKNLAAIVASQKFHPSIEVRLRDAQAQPPFEESTNCKEAAENGQRLAQGALKLMDERKEDVLVYPSWNNPLRLIGDLNTPHENNSPLISPPTGFPAITVPMGFVHGSLPTGPQIQALE